MFSSPKGEEKYFEVLQKMLDILNQLSERPLHVQDQECVVVSGLMYCKKIKKIHKRKITVIIIK